MNFWADGFWASGFWSAGFWGDENQISDGSSPAISVGRRDLPKKRRAEAERRARRRRDEEDIFVILSAFLSAGMTL